MSAEVAEAIRQTRRTLTEKAWVPRWPRWGDNECCLLTATPAPFEMLAPKAGLISSFRSQTGVTGLAAWNDRQSDVGAVLGMTLEALIAELYKGGAA